MSENRETPAVGAPVEETEPSRTEVIEAVERATAAGMETVGDQAAVTAPGDSQASLGHETSETETVIVTDSVGEEIVVTEVVPATPAIDATPVVAPAVAAAKPQGARIAETEDLPSAAADPSELALLPTLNDTPERDGEIRISADHPMAALYTQTPAPPEIRGNRGAGVLISLLATVGFVLVFAGVVAAWNAPHYPPSTFLDKGLLPHILSLGFAVTAVGFFCAMTLLVLIVGRAGWWAYILGGFLVAVFVWLAAILGSALQDRFVDGTSVSWDIFALIETYGLTLPAIAAALIAREASIWFGSWIGARGRRVKQRNAEALAEYEAALSEVQAKQL